MSPILLPLRRSAAMAAAAALLSGCATVPDLPQGAALPAPESLAASRSFSAADADWPADAWWRAYGDPQLDALIGEALAGSPDLASAEARVRKAEALAGQARAALLPSLTLNGQVQSMKQSYNNGFPAAFVPHGYKDSTRATVDFAYEFDFFGKNRASLAAALGEADAARADQAAARLTLSTAVAGAYADLAQLYADQDAALDARRIREASAGLIAERAQNGLENQGAVAQAQAGAASARAEAAAIAESIDLTRNRIAALMGAGPDRGLAIQRPPAATLKAFGLPDDLRANLLGRRPDVTAARLRAEAAAQRVKAAKADFYPDVQLAAYLGRQSLGLDLFTKGGSVIGAVGPALSLPIFEGGRLRAAYRGADADYDAAVAAYQGTIVQALQDVADVAVSAKALETRLSESRAALDSAQRAYDVALARYKGGLATYLDVLTAEDALIANRRAVADLETRAFSLDVALARALGGGFAAA
ncbi:MAG: efflux transporter outer membrane subunit [Phenylobacterium sp.]|uniref:efflux transporter outer membrane subunit n=1 Tax=Phenylobacterium sp. TaxID=1871053 RepID=UPI00391A5FDE